LAESGATLTRREILIVFSGLMLALLLAALDSTVVATALPTIVGELGGLDRLAWVVTAYLLAQTVVTPLYGKLGDLYGRKVVLQVAIVIFLLGSALCGLSGSMMQLIVFRAMQGLGGGGLRVTTQAVVGDIVPPRERGRYQGIFGAVFGVSSIAGPLLGGYFTTHLSWRWIFYINLPLGAIALAVIAATLPRRAERVQHRVDYIGAALLATMLSAIVLVADLGGGVYAWNSPVIPALILTAIIALILFVLVERRAAEPVLPLRLFANRTFTVCTAVGLIVGFALFGSVTYLPLFLQVVNGASPTGSGLQMLPLMGGMLVTSIVSGQLISRSGRYRIFPIVGTSVIATGMFLFSRMNAGTSVLEASAYMLVLGLGLGMVMQVLVIAIQNAVDHRDLGVATSGATMFRLIGGSVGTAVFGAVFAARLAAHLARVLTAGTPGGTPHAGGLSPQLLARLEPGLRQLYVTAFSASLSTVFLLATGIALIGFGLAWLVPDRTLRDAIAAKAGDVGTETRDIFPLPTSDDSDARLEHLLALLATRDTKRRFLEQVVARAQLELSPAAAWLLTRLGTDPGLDPQALARERNIDAAHVAGALAELEQRGLALRDGARRELTPAGRDAFERLIGARRAHLTAALDEWRAEPELHGHLRRFAHDLVPDATPRA
jgi:EmrB/QacA subfamily drug resistance transporter